MNYLKKIIWILFLVFSLQVGLDETIMSWLTCSSSSEISSPTSDYCLNIHSFHSHEDDCTVLARINNPNTCYFYFVRIVFVNFSLQSNYFCFVWQPPRIS
jgi:hypothetical protein